VLGRDRVLRFFAGLLAKVPPGLRARAAEVNGMPGIAVLHDGEGPTYIGQLVVDADGRIAEILFVIAPSKLAFARRQRGRLAG
jgi:hypothetical protein